MTDILEAAELPRLHLYELGKKLGEGAFGAVRLARHLLANEEVAIKCVDTSQLKSEYEFKALEREIEIVQRLNHPHCIQLYEVLSVDDNVYFVTEKASTDLLSVIIDAGTISERKARRYTRHLVKAVSYIHSIGIIHRDIKVENLLVGGGDRLILIDFGLSNTLEGDQLLSTWCGSMAYSAPELLGKKPYDFSVDVWGIGVCLYVMLCGKLPFPADGLTQLHAAILDKNYELPKHFGDALKELLDGIFEFKPKRRMCVGEIAMSAWINDDCEPLNLKHTIEAEPVDSALLEHMQRMGIIVDFQKATELILKQQSGRTFATYSMLLHKKKHHERRVLRRASTRASLRSRPSQTSITSTPNKVRAGSARSRNGSFKTKRGSTRRAGSTSPILTEGQGRSRSGSLRSRPTKPSSPVTPAQPRPRRLRRSSSVGDLVEAMKGLEHMPPSSPPRPSTQMSKRTSQTSKSRPPSMPPRGHSYATLNQPSHATERRGSYSARSRRSSADIKQPHLQPPLPDEVKYINAEEVDLNAIYEEMIQLATLDDESALVSLPLQRLILKALSIAPNLDLINGLRQLHEEPLKHLHQVGHYMHHSLLSFNACLQLQTSGVLRIATALHIPTPAPPKLPRSRSHHTMRASPMTTSRSSKTHLPLLRPVSGGPDHLQRASSPRPEGSRPGSSRPPSVRLKAL
eukprot:TRINITY_DN10661_c0_g1_i2.p1 TRINITY_DN10661_c0_g1~~TRINITY_DN10661_c0_g1_i2.p1  ORF type:complete len:686 (+),score=107.96 TRINITY_DN10661_c0_g1_i2:140-2197(+)